MFLKSGASGSNQMSAERQRIWLTKHKGETDMESINSRIVVSDAQSREDQRKIDEIENLLKIANAEEIDLILRFSIHLLK